MKTLVTQHEYPNLFTTFETYKKKLGLNPRLKLYVTDDDALNGRCASKRYITVTSGLLKSHIPIETLNYMVAHELIHFLYKEYKILKILNNVACIFGNNKARGLRLLSEIRAATDGIVLAGLNKKGTQKSQITLYKTSDKSRKIDWYKNGYPSRASILKYANKYGGFSDIMAHDILIDFCLTLKITKDQHGFIERVIDKFR